MSPNGILTDDELQRLLAAFADEHRLIFETLAETGARLSEGLGIVWGDIDFEAETVRITHQLGRDGKRRPLKTKRSRRTLEVTPLLISKLPPTRWPAPLSRASTPPEHGNVSGRLMARAVERAGLEAIERNGEVVEPAPTPHDLRHTHASRLIADG